jgi:hypothetical protein
VLLVQPITAELFTVAIADTAGFILLHSSVYAPENVDSLAP